MNGDVFEIWKNGELINSIVSSQSFAEKYAKKIGGHAKHRPPQEVAILQKKCLEHEQIIETLVSYILEE